MEEKLLAYLQVRLCALKDDLNKFGAGDRIVMVDMDKLIACKEMAETLIGKPINLQMDGRVTVGF